MGGRTQRIVPQGRGRTSPSATDEELRYEWELEYIVNHKHRKDRRSEDDEWD